MQHDVCLVIVFNHRYDSNIPKLRKIYEKRFSVIRFLVPFYDGNDKDVITVYECSYEFQGYFAQAYKELEGTGCECFLFIGDDLILHPLVSESNFESYFKLENKRFFIQGLSELNHKGRIAWEHSRYSSRAFLSEGTSWKTELPDYDKALRRFNKFFGKKYNEIYDDIFFDAPIEAGELDRLKESFYIQNGERWDIPYPMAYGYSDIFVINRDSLYEFTRKCGIFAAMNLFVEISIPTAAVLTFKRSEVSLLKDTGMTKVLQWDDEEYFKNIGPLYDYSFSDFYDSWDDKMLYVHPIKLSKWKV